jgi:glycosyltransferase involved in cell wall biosynthesis
VILAHVTAPGEFGGLERVVAALAKGQRAGGHDVHVAVVLDPGRGADHPLVAELREGGVATHILTPPRRAYRRERRQVRELCAAIRPAVVHTHGYRADVVASGAARSLGIPLVTTVHGFTGGDWKNRVYELLQRRAWRRYDAVVAVSRPLGERLSSRLPAEVVRVVPNAWAAGAAALDRAAARAVLGLSPEGRRVGWVGRLTAEKGADVLLESVPALPDGVGVSFLGAGRESARLAARIAQLGAADRVRLHGAVPDAGRLLRAFDVLVLSSRTEGTPIVLFEAMAAGVPVVATAVGGVPDVVTPDEALLVPPESPAELAAGVAAVLGDAPAALARAEAARRRLVERFAPGPWLAAYEEVYRQVTERR